MGADTDDKSKEVEGDDKDLKMLKEIAADPTVRQNDRQLATSRLIAAKRRAEEECARRRVLARAEPTHKGDTKNGPVAQQAPERYLQRHPERYLDPLAPLQYTERWDELFKERENGDRVAPCRPT